MWGGGVKPQAHTHQTHPRTHSIEIAGGKLFLWNIPIRAQFFIVVEQTLAVTTSPL